MTTDKKEFGKKAEQEQTSPKNVSASKPKFVYIKRYWQLYVLLILPMVYFVIFKYIPMAYVRSLLKSTVSFRLFHRCPGQRITVLSIS